MSENRKWQFKILIKDKIRKHSFEYLKSENLKLKKTRRIEQKDVGMQKYLCPNDSINSEMAAFIFSIRSGTTDIKDWNSFRYENNLCYGCEEKEENFEHLMFCQKLSPNHEIIEEKIAIEEIFGDNLEYIIKIAKIAWKRFKFRQELKLKHEQPMDGPAAPGISVAIGF